MAVGTIERDPRNKLAGFYSKFYGKHKSDSPDTSRASLLRRAHPYMSELTAGKFVLEVGSGRQIVTRQYLRDRFTRFTFTMVTLDIAELRRKQLLAKDSANVTHVRADGTHLPFQTDSFSLVMSNMALDFMGEEAIAELFRVLKPQGRAEVNLHHPSLIPDNLDKLLTSRKASKTERAVLEHWDYLRTNHILTSEPDILLAKFTRHGFSITRLEEAKDSTDTWWELSIRKQ